jgi:hypothetical protein
MNRLKHDLIDIAAFGNPGTSIFSTTKPSGESFMPPGGFIPSPAIRMRKIMKYRKLE